MGSIGRTHIKLSSVEAYPSSVVATSSSSVVATSSPPLAIMETCKLSVLFFFICVNVISAIPADRVRRGSGEENENPWDGNFWEKPNFWENNNFGDNGNGNGNFGNGNGNGNFGNGNGNGNVGNNIGNGNFGDNHGNGFVGDNHANGNIGDYEEEEKKNGEQKSTSIKKYNNC